MHVRLLPGPHARLTGTPPPRALRRRLGGWMSDTTASWSARWTICSINRWAEYTFAACGPQECPRTAMADAVAPTATGDPAARTALSRRSVAATHRAVPAQGSGLARQVPLPWA